MRVLFSKQKALFLGFFLVGVALVCGAGNTSAQIIAPEMPTPPKGIIKPPQLPFKSVCDPQGISLAHCHAKVVTNTSGVTPLVTNSTPYLSSLTPDQLHTAYQLPCTPGGVVQSVCATPSNFGPKTIALILSYHNPNLESDLATYSSYFGLPQCTRANGCLRVVNETGGSSLPSLVDSGWTLESSMDVQVAHAICQTCKILVIEATINTYNALGMGVNTAANLGATSISNSYGSNEFSGENTFDTYYNHPGVAVTVSSGDNGYGVQYPASSPNVIAVGGTTLNLLTDNTYSSESVWDGAGSGCSLYENANTWQTSLPNWGQTFCSKKRSVTDISAVADPNTGVAVYDSTSYGGSSGWFQVGGTSLSSPIIAASFALGGGVPMGQTASSTIYKNSASFHDITNGSNGFCGTIMCFGSVGYDGPTGLGSPKGINGFISDLSTSPTPTLTPTLTPTPTPPTDTQAPSIIITNPLDGSTVRHGNSINLVATATDNVKVTKVEFYINGSLYRTDISSPYRVSWTVPNPRGVVYLITAKAYDAALNTSTNSVIVTSR